MEDMKSNATAKVRKIPQETFRQCFRNGRIAGTNMCARKGLVAVYIAIKVQYHNAGTF
jgi:hypothetical protein